MAPSPPTPDELSAESARRRLAGLRVAFVHDWLLGMRGGERVLEALLPLFPLAEIYTLFYDPRGVSDAINRRAVHPSPLGRLPGSRRYYRNLLPLMPGAIERLRLPRSLDLVISTSHCAAHGARVPGGVRHLAYCFSPMRYLYDQRENYARGGARLGTRALEALAPRLTRWDCAAALRGGRYWAISRFVADRIRRVYGLEADVVYPPVDAEFFAPAGPDRRRYEDHGGTGDGPWLVVSALTPYKRVDLAIEAAGALGRELIVVGSGPLEAELRARAGPTVRFLGWVDDAHLREVYRSCRALIFPGEEDFGIAPLEAMACGLPVLALRAGGLTETHVEGVTGEFFDEPTVEALAAAWQGFDPARYDRAAIRAHAERFAVERFRDEFAVKLMKQIV